MYLRMLRCIINLQRMQGWYQPDICWLPCCTCCHNCRDCCWQQIIASDGVWDVMDAREAANRVMDVISGGGTADEAARQLVRDTVMLAECSPDGDADNTSAIVLVFE
jgi:hypothetical protein